MKIGICIDPQLSEAPPRCRVDDFLQAGLDKLEYIANESDKVIIVGDMFERYFNSTKTFNRVYKMLSQYPNKWIILAGNHDVFERNYSDIAMERTTLGSLKYTGVAEVINENMEFTLDGTTFQTSMCTAKSKIPDLPIDENNEKILLGHNYFEMMTAPEESFTRDDIRRLNYKFVFLGHDHKPYEEEFIGNSILIRMGALTRQDSQEYNKERGIFYYSYDTETKDYTQKKVPHEPIEKCYNPTAFIKVNKEEKKIISLSEIAKSLKCAVEEGEGAISLEQQMLEMGATNTDLEITKRIHINTGVRYN